MKNEKLGLYIRTSTKNYILNLSASLTISIILSYLANLNGWHRPWLFLIFLFYFYTLFRIGEFLLTGKSLPYYGIFGYISEGAQARFDFILHVITFILFLGFLFVKHN